MKVQHWMAAGLAVLTLGSTCLADTIFLKDGTEVDGMVIESNANTVVVQQTNGVTRSYRRADVDTIVKSPKINVVAAPAPAAETPPAAGTEPAGNVNPPSAPSAENRDNPAVPAAPAVPGAPAGRETAGSAEPQTGQPGEAKPGDKKTEKKDGKDTDKEDEKWSPPPGLDSFPDHAKRMPKEKEAIFMDALAKLADHSDPAGQEKAKSDILALGPDVLPYVVAGFQHASIDARTSCMKMVTQLDGNRAIKQTIEVFYAAMPQEGRCAWYQVPFIDAIKLTLTSLTGQSFINVESKDALVQDGLKQYIEWYKASMMGLPKQLGEKKISETDPDYVKKVADSRELKLVKRDWPQPPQLEDLQNAGRAPDRPTFDAQNTTRDADTKYQQAFPKIGRDDALKRPQDKQE